MRRHIKRVCFNATDDLIDDGNLNESQINDDIEVAVCVNNFDNAPKSIEDFNYFRNKKSKLFFWQQFIHEGMDGGRMDIVFRAFNNIESDEGYANQLETKLIFTLTKMMMNMTENEIK